YLAAGICLFFMVGEAVGGDLAHSLAILTDAAHLLTDFASIMISLFALWVSSRPPTKTMNFGWHRAGNAVALSWGGRGALPECPRGFGVPRGARGAPAKSWRHEQGRGTASPGQGASRDGSRVPTPVGTPGGGSGRRGHPRAPRAPSLQPPRLCPPGTPKGMDFNAVRETLLAVRGVEAVHSLHIWALTAAQPLLAVHIAINAAASAQEVLEEASSRLQGAFRFHSTTIQVESYSEEMRDCRECQPPRD
ncbi:ZNT2 protein, partial [Motacilla alba]|nr:ZNT2 protein [Motacilla alba]